MDTINGLVRIFFDLVGLGTGVIVATVTILVLRHIFRREIGKAGL